MPADIKMRLFHTWFLLTRPMTLGVRALAFDTEGRILLVRHTYISGWHLPGGGVEKGQTMVDALARELREEANVEFGRPPKLQSVHLNTRVTRRDHVVLYLCEDVRQVAPKARDLEIEEARFFTLDELPETVAASTATRIGEFNDGRVADPFW